MSSIMMNRTGSGILSASGGNGFAAGAGGRICIYGALRMSVKLHLMLNSKMIIDGDGEGDPIIATSLLEASNLLVLKGGSVIQSNANLGIHGQGSLNLTGEGNIIEAQHLVISIFCCLNVEPGFIVRGPLQNTSNNYLTYVVG